MARKQAFAGDYSVLQYSSSKAKFGLPELLGVYSPRIRCILGELIHATLDIDETRRPSSKSLLQALETANSRNDEILISGCKHGYTNTVPPGHVEPQRKSSNVIDLAADDKLWASVRWQRHWYFSII
jgi:hypothetical protein